jgi:hypothetical protein
MAELRDVVLYFCINYPYPSELSKARLTKMIYLADWRSAITRGRQITNIQWRYNHHGPYVRDVEQLARNDVAFNIVKTYNAFGSEKEVISATDGAKIGRLLDEERRVLDHVIEITAPMYWDEFVQLVYSTWPILTQPRYENLDLLELARQYKETLPPRYDPNMFESPDV